MKTVFKYFSATLLLIVFSVVSLNAQTFDLDDAPNLWGAHNQFSSINFNQKGVVIEKGKNYFNTLGKANQELIWDVTTGKIWGSQVLYDRQGRPTLHTLSAPINGPFSLSTDFILDQNNDPYSIEDFDTAGTIDNPSIAGINSELRAYYSTSNSDNLYQDVTEYPFLRNVFSKLNPGSIKKILGGNKIEGEWKQIYNFSMDAGTELNAPNAFGSQFDPTDRITKIITRDANGEDLVFFSNSDGNTVAAASSGSEGGVSFTNEIFIGKQGFVDIHIPKGVNGFSIIDPSSSFTLKIYDLITEAQIGTITGNGTMSPGSGFYRIAVSNPVTYGENSAGSIRVEHDVNYYNYLLNYFNKAQLLTSNTQPLSSQMESSYNYNSLGELLDAQSPDEGFAQYLYRKDGQIRFYQNSANSRRVTYTNYDDLGRAIESGVFTWTGAFEALDPDGPSVNMTNKEYVKHILYDVPDLGLGVDVPVCSFPFSEYKQKFIAGAISKTYTENPNTNTSWYSYDSMGRLAWVVQKIDGMDCYKTINYSYNPSTGLVTEVDYQRHEPSERFIHKFTYNQAGQLVTVHTSRTGMDSDWVEQAQYTYAETGELIRTVLAEDLQGIDYVYNINGQLKAINHPTLEPAKDPGGDGLPGSSIAADVFGFAVDYYNGDYIRTGTPTPVAQQNIHGTDQYNGNIKGVRFNTGTSGLSKGGFHTYMYGYNKNNWLDNATFGTGDISANGSGYEVDFTPNGNNDYEVSNLSYDANGNIQALKRNGYTNFGGTNSMDDFTYHYDGNQLQYVEDSGDNADPNRYNDLKNQENNGAPNYTYNVIGQLYSDIEGRAIYEYTPSGLVSRISTFGDNSNPNEQFTLYFQDHQMATNAELDFWSVSSGTKEINEDGTYGGIGSSATCTTLDTQYGKSVEFRMPNNATTTRVFDVLDGVPQTLELSVIVDQYKELVQTGEDHEIPTGYEITLYDGPIDLSLPPVLETRSYNTGLQYIDDPDLPNTSECSGLYERTESFSFTPTGREVTLVLRKITVSDQLPLYIDNLWITTGIIPMMDIVYNDRGHRVRKTFYNPNGNTEETFYVRDLEGTTVGVYTKINSNDVNIKEVAVYGHGRLGDYDFNSFQPDPPTGPDGTYRYQLIDHLGNVRVVLSKAADGTPLVLSKTDYYPFGMPMPYRTQEGDYRYAFQGQEKDPETGKEAFELRIWDNRIGRWLTVDPQGQHSSPYLGMDNNPITNVDLNGGAACPDPPCWDENGDYNAGVLTVVCIGCDSDVIPSWEFPISYGGFQYATNLSPAQYVEVYPEFKGLTYTEQLALFEEKYGEDYNDFINYAEALRREEESIRLGMHLMNVGRTMINMGEVIGPGGFKVPRFKIRSSGPIQRPKYYINEKKYDYFFGKVKHGREHNIIRSAQNKKDLKTLGIKNPKQLKKVFDKAFTDGVLKSAMEGDYGLQIVKRIEVSKKGAIDVVYLYPYGGGKPKITTIIPKIYK